MTTMDIPGATSTPTVILTGPTRGLGHALFVQLVSQDYPIVAVGRDLARIDDVAMVASAPVELVEVDLGDDDDALERVLDALRRIILATTAGPLVFISNASIIEPIGPATCLTLAGLERALRINCLTPILMANTLTEIADTQHRPLLVFDVSSGAASRPVRGWQAYCTSKAAYKMALDVLAAENSHVQVTHFDPGIMDTPMQQVIRGQREEDMPEVAAFRAYQDEGLLKAPPAVAADIILQMRRHLR